MVLATLPLQLATVPIAMLYSGPPQTARLPPTAMVRLEIYISRNLLITSTDPNRTAPTRTEPEAPPPPPLFLLPFEHVLQVS